MICLSSKRGKGLWTRVGPNSPPVSTKGHTQVGFCGGGTPGYGSKFGYKKGEPGNSGVMGGEPSWDGGEGFLLICLVGSLLGHTTISYLRQSSFIS